MGQRNGRKTDFFRISSLMNANEKNQVSFVVLGETKTKKKKNKIKRVQIENSILFSLNVSFSIKNCDEISRYARMNEKNVANISILCDCMAVCSSLMRESKQNC